MPHATRPPRYDRLRVQVDIYSQGGVFFQEASKAPNTEVESENRRQGDDVRAHLQNALALM